MAEQQNAPEPQEEGSPFTRPAFLVAAVLVLVIVLIGIVVAFRVASTNAATPPSPVPPSESFPSTQSTPPPDSDASICGLTGRADGGPLEVAPAATWEFQGTIAYPSSREFGPGKTSDQGYRYCFQRTPAGALFMAANALAQGSDQQIGDQWVQYALGEGKYREQLLTRLGSSRGSAGMRVKVAGFRVLSYTADKARVDIGVRASSQNQNLAASSVYELVWQDGDWKIDADVERPLDVATIPNLEGYVPWGE